MVASGSLDKTLRLWDLASHDCVATLTGHTQMISTVAFSRDGRQMVSGSWDGTVRLWDVASRSCSLISAYHKDWVHSVAFLSDGCSLVSGGSDMTMQVWDGISRSCTSTVLRDMGAIISVASRSLVCESFVDRGCSLL
jgi:WD40 repeat protein